MFHAFKCRRLVYYLHISVAKFLRPKYGIRIPKLSPGNQETEACDHRPRDRSPTCHTHPTTKLTPLLTLSFLRYTTSPPNAAFTDTAQQQCYSEC